MKNAETTFGVYHDTSSTLSRGSGGLKKGNMIQHGVYHEKYVNFL
jgi:hypothetical protein